MAVHLAADDHCHEQADTGAEHREEPLYLRRHHANTWAPSREPALRVNGVFQQLWSCEFFSHSSSSSSSCEFHSHSSSQLVAPVTVKTHSSITCRAASLNLTAATTVATSCENVTHSSSTLSSCGKKWAYFPHSFSQLLEMFVTAVKIRLTAPLSLGAAKSYVAAFKI